MDVRRLLRVAVTLLLTGIALLALAACDGGNADVKHGKRGPQGEQGPAGEDGAPGSDGSDGEDGESQITISVDLDYCGPDGDTLLAEADYVLGYNAFCTIQEGVDAADYGSVVHVGPADDGVTAYTPARTIVIPHRMTLTGDPGDTQTAGAGASAPIIDGGGQNISALVVSGGSYNVVIEGLVVQNFATNSAATGHAVHAASAEAVDDITVRHNTFRNLGASGIFAGSTAARYSTWVVEWNAVDEFGGDGIALINVGESVVESNVITGTTGTRGIFLQATQVAGGSGVSVDNVQVLGNTISATVGTAGIELHAFDQPGGVVTTLLGAAVSGNTVSGVPAGLRLAVDGSAASLESLAATGNSFSGNTDGVALASSTVGGFVTSNVDDNDIDTNTNGVHVVASTDPTGVAVRSNRITGNTNFGALHSSGGNPPHLDARENWWGSADGPSGFGPGTGDAVSDNVDFDPWYIDEERTTLSP